MAQNPITQAQFLEAEALAGDDLSEIAARNALHPIQANADTY